MGSGSPDEKHPPEEWFTGERLALAESLSAPLQADEPFDRVLRAVIEGMVPKLGDVALAVVPSERDGYDIITSARTPDAAEAVRHRVRELLPVLSKVARDEARRGPPFIGCL